MKSAWRAVALVVCLMASVVPAAWAQDYLLGPEDVVVVSVYLHPELEKTATINADGNLTFPPIGEIKAAGLTTKQLADRITERLSSYLRQSTSVTVTVSQYMSRSVIVSGAVARPGRYGFERIPNIIDVIGQAGGVTPGADLSRVEIIRREQEARRTLTVNVAQALRDGTIASLPALQAGDAITIPGGIGFGGSGGAAGGAAVDASTPGVGVIGEVTRPGLYPVGGGQELWTVLSVAGGVTPFGDLSTVRVLTRDDDRQSVVTFNLKDILRRGNPAPFTVRPGDIVFVPRSPGSRLTVALGGVSTLFGISRDLLEILVFADVLAGEN